MSPPSVSQEQAGTALGTDLSGLEASCWRKDDASVCFRGVDYAAFEPFLMSMLWKARVSTRSEFGALRLGVHENRVRDLMPAGDPGKAHEYARVMCFPPNRRIHEIFSKVISPADMLRAPADRVYRFLLAGVFWLYFASGQMATLPNRVALSLLQDGTLRADDAGTPMMDYLLGFGLEMTGADAMRRVAPHERVRTGLDQSAGPATGCSRQHDGSDVALLPNRLARQSSRERPR